MNPTQIFRRLIVIYTILLVANLAIWAWAVVALHNHPVLLGTALLAYAFGLRHAVASLSSSRISTSSSTIAASSRIFRPPFALITKSWHLFPIGFLFRGLRQWSGYRQGLFAPIRPLL